MKLWGGRFSKDTDELMDDFNSSIHFDVRMYKQDILGSAAHAGMLGKCGIIPAEDAELIRKTLFEILEDIENGKVKFEISAEDIHMNIESILISRIGDVGKRLHTGRSRNDQVALDIRMYLRDESSLVKTMLCDLLKALLTMAEDNLDTIMPGYTHLQRAQPITFAHHLMAYFQMFRRDIERLDDCVKRMNIMPLGSGALAGTTYPLDREMVAKELGFSGITENSLDGVSDRDFVIELASCFSIIMMHLSRFCEELILWSSSEFNFIEIDDTFATGSSIMPQKKNPDMAELIRGKTGRVYGALFGLLTVMKGTPLAYNKDFQEDKEGMFDAVKTVKGSLQIFAGMIETLTIKTDVLEQTVKADFSNATELADYLATKGMPFREAHEVVGKLVLYCIQKGVFLLDLTIDEYKEASPLFEEDIYEVLQPKTVVSRRNSLGGTGFEQVKLALEKAKKALDE